MNNQPFFSVIMPSYLHDFVGGATDREAKFIRAVDSILLQTFKDFELIVIADGCVLTSQVLKRYSKQMHKKINLIEMPKHPKFSGRPRNAGITMAKGQQIVYMDTDDCAGRDHLQIIRSQLTEQSWHFFNDWVGDKEHNFTVRHCSPQIKGNCGTSNICHKNKLLIDWPDGYAHDWQFIQKLMKISNPIFIKTIPQYYVCHIPKKLDI